MKLTRFEDLTCWQEARDIINRVYRVCRVDGFKKDYSLVDQVKRAAISIMGNIAEGFSRKGNKEFIQFLFIAKSSAAELQSHLYIALDQGYIERKQFDEIYEQASKTAMIISGLIKYFRSKSTKPTKQTNSTKQTRETK